MPKQQPPYQSLISTIQKEYYGSASATTKEELTHIGSYYKYLLLLVEHLMASLPRFKAYILGCAETQFNSILARLNNYTSEHPSENKNITYLLDEWTRLSYATIFDRTLEVSKLTVVEYLEIIALELVMLETLESADKTNSEELLGNYHHFIENGLGSNTVCYKLSKVLFEYLDGFTTKKIPGLVFPYTLLPNDQIKPHFSFRTARWWYRIMSLVNRNPNVPQIQ